MNFVRKSLNSLVKLQRMFRIAEIELGMENTIGITLETGVGVQSAILTFAALTSFKISDFKVTDAAWILQFRASLCGVVWCGTGH